MKPSLSLKLGAGVVLFFGVVLGICIAWTPIKIRYHVRKIRSSDPKERIAGVDGLLKLGKRGEAELIKNLDDPEEGVLFLIEHWNDFNAEIETEVGRRPVLHYAIRKGYTVVVGLMIDQFNVGRIISWNRCPFVVFFADIVQLDGVRLVVSFETQESAVLCVSHTHQFGMFGESSIECQQITAENILRAAFLQKGDIS